MLPPVAASDSDADADADPDSYTELVHEMGIALEVYKTCREAVDTNGGGRLQEARLAVGELTAVEPELLVFAWEAVVAEGPDAGAELNINWCPAVQLCSDCGEIEKRAEGSWLRLCPECGKALQVIGGEELDVLQVSFEADDPEDAAGENSQPEGSKK